MSGTADYAKKELDIHLSLEKGEDDLGSLAPYVPEIISIAEKFGTAGHGGGSASYIAPYIAWVIEKLLLMQPISPIMGGPDEWMEISTNEGVATYQNIRCSNLFKESNMKPHYLDAIIFKTSDGNAWSGSAKLPLGENIYSRQFIKAFPFQPKTFYINVVDRSTPEGIESLVEDTDQLRTVFEYYEAPLTVMDYLKPKQ